MTAPVALSAVDFDRDGDADVVAASSVNDEIRWYENTGGDGSTWTDHVIVDGPSATGLSAARVLDFDSDGDFDVLSIDASGGVIAWFENSLGDASSWIEQSIDTFGGAPAGHPAVDSVDLDRDGDLDIVAADFGAGAILWYENRGGQFALPTTATAPAVVGPYGEEDVLQISLVHRGRPGDHAVSFDTVELEFADGVGTPLTSAQLADLLTSLRVYLDDGNGFFQDGDSLVAKEILEYPGPSGRDQDLLRRLRDEGQRRTARPDPAPGHARDRWQ
jgi:hypothetical protein